MVESLGIIFKISERCNLNCRYCYYFNSGDTSYKLKLAKFPEKNISQLLIWLLQAIEELKLNRITIGFHGGEPLLYGKKDFLMLCSRLQNTLSQKVQLSLNIQTNGTLLDKDWISLFKEYNIDLGISIDGPKDYHDKHRVDHFGIGSYDRLIKKIELLHQISARFGVLTVINPQIGGKNLYNFITNELCVQSFDILFPHLTHDEEPKYLINKYGKFLCDLFDVWVENDDPKIKIRLFNSYLGQLLGKEGMMYGVGAKKKLHIPLITIRGDGEISPVTGLMYTDPDTVTNTGANIFDTSLRKFLEYPIFSELAKAQTVMPQKCSECCWEKICGGGNIIDRFSKKNRFNNSSTYCIALQQMYAHMTGYLLNTGIPMSDIKNSLEISA